MVVLMRKCATVLLIFLLLRGSVPFCSPNAVADNAMNDPLIIRVGAYENPPKIYTDETGAIVGLFPDVLNYIAEKEGWKFNYVHGTWSECLDRLEKNEIDLMVDVAYSEERGSLFSPSFGVTKTSIIFNSSHLKLAFPRESPLASMLIEKIDRHLYEMKKDPGSVYNKALNVYLSGLPRELIFAEQERPQNITVVHLTAREKAWIHDHPRIRIGVDPEFAPFEFMGAGGVYSGIASDYLNLLSQRLGLKVEVMKNLTWKEAMEKALIGEIDLLPCVGITQERKKFLNFSQSYINFYRAIITRTDTPFLTGLGDIETMKVAVQKSSSHEGYLRENTSIEPILYDTLQRALLAVSNGQAQAFVGNIASSTYWIRKLNLTNLKVAAPVSQDSHTLHFAVRADWPELVTMINKGLASITPEEETHIRNRWVNIDYKPGIAPRVVWRYLLQISALALVILMVILVWNYRLKKEIQKRIEIDAKLTEANKDLKKLDQLKSMFIASMSHELRTPLNSIIGFTGVIVQGMVGPLNEKQKDHLTRVYNSARHLLSLITDVIDISKIEAGRIDVYPEVLVLSEIVDEAVINIEPQLKAKHLKFNRYISEDLQLHTDRKRLLQCIINYLSNAVKFTETGSITLTAGRCNQRPGDISGQLSKGTFGKEGEGNFCEKVEILITDTGIGIPQAEQSKLFEAFERLDSRLRVKAGGTGLGLYLTRKLVTEILGGEIVFRSEEGRGSTFGLVIPVSLATEPSPKVE